MSAEPNLTLLTAHIVAAYVEANEVPASTLPDLIQSVSAALRSLDAPDEATAEKPTPPTPSEIRRSIKPEALISFEDGKPYKGLKRHLATRGMTPAAYRAKWGLPADYPMVSANYSAARSAFAKSTGLGRKPPPAPVEPAPAPVAKARKRLGLFGAKKAG
jgi:predicted transcriptional regulator